MVPSDTELLQYASRSPEGDLSAHELLRKTWEVRILGGFWGLEMGPQIHLILQQLLHHALRATATEPGQLKPSHGQESQLERRLADSHTAPQCCCGYVGARAARMGKHLWDYREPRASIGGTRASRAVGLAAGQQQIDFKP